MPVVTVTLPSVSSTLVLERVVVSQGGNYSCRPASISPAHTLVHVVESTGEQRLPVTDRAVGRRAGVLLTMGLLMACL